MTTTAMEGNRIIAEFMGWKQVNSVHLEPMFMPSDSMAGLVLSEMQYHTSWNWLMPVVEKIEAMNFGVKQCRKVVEIYFDDSKEVIIKCKESSRIESLYTAVVQFINWYNTSNRPDGE